MLILRVATPPANTADGLNSWYVHSEGVSEVVIRETAQAMHELGLCHGWSYVFIDDCWMGERDPQTQRIQANAKFKDMPGMVADVNALGLKVGLYSTTWMSTFAGYIGGSAPTETGDYSAHYLPEDQRQNPHQVFGRFPSGIEKRLCEVGPVWFVDRDAAQFAEWGIDYVTTGWVGSAHRCRTTGGRTARPRQPPQTGQRHHPTFYQDFRALDRDIVLSLWRTPARRMPLFRRT